MNLLCQINLFYGHYHIYQSTKLFLIYMQDLLDSNRPGITHKHSVSRKKGRPIVSGTRCHILYNHFNPFVRIT